MIGPHRGGRTVGVAGITDQPNVFYIGVNNGGVWRTDDYGRTWAPIFDDQPTGSIGALAVAPSNPKVIYVGSGEGLQRPDLSVGDGVFKSTDEGKTWKLTGLEDAQQIGAVLVDPRDENHVFAAVLGHPYGSSEQRGIFRSTDGGSSWARILYKDENTGGIALEFDPSNPDILFAVLWASRQGPWENGEWEGKTSGLYKSTDGGTTWRQLTGGLPTGDQGLGRIGIGISRSDPHRMYAVVEAPDLGGVYRSDDSGEHWTRTNHDDRVYGRGSDFGEIKVAPLNKEIVYVANTCTYRSTDGGTTFTAFKGAPGGDDYHTIWINPKNPDIILLASDQGATITVNGGKTWSSWYNQPTAQFYHVVTDNQFPYNVYGGQQESGSVGISSRGDDGEITFRDWHPVAADEWAYIAPDPLNPNIIYGGKCSRYDKLTGQSQNVAPEALRSGKYRYIRTSPLMFSPANPRALYLASNVLFRTTDGGMKWDVVSPDLSREMPDVPPSVGIFRTPEMAKQPRRGVIYALGLSPLDEKFIWTGTDDGLVHRTTDGGKRWVNITPPELTAWSKVAGIDAGHFDGQTAYVAVNRLRLDDLRPYVYRTHDGGATWKKIVVGLPSRGPVNAVREDPYCKGLLYAGTERAVYVSFDDGDNWQPLRLNMPATSIRDLVVHRSDLVVGTHGRSFWILDDITPLRRLAARPSLAGGCLYPPDTAVRVRWNKNTDTPLPPDEPGGENPPDGAIIDYVVPPGASAVSLEIFDRSHRLVRRFTGSDPPEYVDTTKIPIPTYWIRPPMRLLTTPGMHRFIWDMHVPPPDTVPRGYPMTAIVHNTPLMPKGPWVTPGRYDVVLTIDGKKMEGSISVVMDPRLKISAAALKQQFDLSMTCFRALDQILQLRNAFRALSAQIVAVEGRIADAPLADSLRSLERRMKALQGEDTMEDVDILYFDDEDSSLSKVNINSMRMKMLYLMMTIQSVDAQPTPVQIAAVHEQQNTLDGMSTWWKKIRSTGLAKINMQLARLHLEPLQ